MLDDVLLQEIKKSRAIPDPHLPPRKFTIFGLFVSFSRRIYSQSAPKERQRRRAEKRLSKRVFLESPFLLCPLKVCS